MNAGDCCDLHGRHAEGFSNGGGGGRGCGGEEECYVGFGAGGAPENLGVRVAGKEGVSDEDSPVEKTGWESLRLASLKRGNVEGRAGVTYVPATVSGALVQIWARAANKDVSGIDKPSTTERTKMTRHDRLKARMLQGVNGEGNQAERNGHARREKNHHLDCFGSR